MTMHVGIAPRYDPNHSGEFNYGVTMLRALALSRLGEASDGLRIVCPANAYAPLASAAGVAWRNVEIFPPFHLRRAKDAFRRIAGDAVSARIAHWMRKKESGSADGRLATHPEIGEWYRRNGVGFVYWGYMTALSYECGVPCAVAVHDLQHRVQASFASTFSSWELHAREFFVQKIARAATLFVVDSEVGKEDLLEAYGKLISAERVRVLPFIAPLHVLEFAPRSGAGEAVADPQLPARFFFYPAQFLPHKNHAVVVRAMAMLRDRGERDLYVVFAGSRFGDLRSQTHRAVMRLAESIGVANRVIVLGFASNDRICQLYRFAIALVMPTVLGPTNIPVLEAWAMGCPVITSDIRGIRDQVGDAGLLVDPDAPDQLADAMMRVAEDDTLRRSLVERGLQRSTQWTLRDFGDRLASILEEGYALSAR